MPIVDWWTELDGKIEESRKLKQSAQGGAKAGGFSPAEWAEAREKHKAKMNVRTSSP